MPYDSYRRSLTKLSLGINVAILQLNCRKGLFFGINVNAERCSGVIWWSLMQWRRCFNGFWLSFRLLTPYIRFSDKRKSYINVISIFICNLFFCCNVTNILVVIIALLFQRLAVIDNNCPSIVTIVWILHVFAEFCRLNCTELNAKSIIFNSALQSHWLCLFGGRSFKASKSVLGSCWRVHHRIKLFHDETASREMMWRGFYLCFATTRYLVSRKLG